MKNVIVTSVVILFTFFTSQAQKYYPIPTSNITWNVKVHDVNAGFSSIYSYGTIKDSIFNDTLYHELKDNGRLGFFREKDRIVYFRDYFNNEIILYNFSLTPGNSYKQKAYEYASERLISYSNDSITYTLDYIDSVMVAGSKRANYHFSGDLNYANCIEGLGSTVSFGFLAPIYPICTCQIYYTLNSVVYGDTTLYSSITDDISYLNQSNNGVKIFPNPIINNATITLPNDVKNGILKLINSSGKTVYTRDISNEKTIKFERNGLAPGLYLLQIYSGNQPASTQKMIIGNIR